MNINSEWLLAAIALALLFCAGFWMRLRALAREKKRIPKQWPLHARVLVNSEELRVWRWLSETFDDHHVMIKTPVTRFMRPNATENGLYWYDLLQNTACTFSISTVDGHVVGCVDVPKSHGLSQKARNLKTNLLAQCGISYVVLSSNKLPSPAEIRNAFLGEEAEKSRNIKREEAAVAAARVHLRRTLMQQRDMRKLKPYQDDLDNPSSSMPTDWHDSFLIQSNSRPSELRHADGRLMA